MSANKNEQSPSVDLSSYKEVRDRLDEIAKTVSDSSLPLDEALDLYEEAVALGLKASDLLEQGVKVPEQDAEQDAEREQAGQADKADSSDAEKPAASSEADSKKA